MKTVLYTKYNSTRKPEYQLSTSIIEEYGTKYVVKKAIQPKAVEHLKSLSKKRAVLEKLYDGIDIVACEEKDDAVVFPFVKGKSLLEGIDFKEDDVEDIVQKIKTAMSKISKYNKDNCCTFEMTEGFREMFGYYIADKDVEAICPANIDGILSNFVELEDGSLCSIDYEWVVDFPMPVKFLEYRTLFYLYKENYQYLEKRITETEFFAKFGLSMQDITLFAAMEVRFQENVRGDGMAYAYPERYYKKTTSLKQLQDAIDANVLTPEKEKMLELNLLEEKEAEIKELQKRIAETFNVVEKQQMHINKLSRMIKNPFYGVSCILKKISGHDSETEEKTPQEITLEYREKYDHILNPGKPVYDKWILHREKDESYDDEFISNPVMSLCILVESYDKNALQTTINSIKEQIYSNWEVCVVAEEKIVESIKRDFTEDVKVVAFGGELDVASGEFIAYLNAGDLLRKNALYEIVKEINKNAKVDFVYSDEDMVDENGRNRHNPFFKPSWSPDTLMSFWYTGHLSVYRKDIAVQLEGLDYSLAEGKEYDFALRFTERTSKVAHVEKVLYHVKDRKQISLKCEQCIKERALSRRGLEAKLEVVDEMQQLRVNYVLRENPLVSIIIPSKDNYEIIKTCIESLVNITSYKNYEIILVDNGSNEENKANYQFLCDTYNIKYVYSPMKFNFSKMCNLGVSHARGDYYVLLNDDMEIIQPEWLERMIAHASLEHVGAVGAKLLYPNTDLIQHIGVVMYHDGPAHALTKYTDSEMYSFGRNRVDYNWLAVTAACLAVRADKYKEVNMFNENLVVTFNDVDFCFKLVEAGYYNVVRNDVVLYHHESISRGEDHIDENKRARSNAELQILKIMHPQFVATDPFYNKNLVQNNVSFENDYYLYVPEKYEVKNMRKVELATNEDEQFMCSVDIVEEEEGNIYVRGWGFIPGRLDNNDLELQLVLKGVNDSYVVETEKDYRTDVAEGFSNELYIEFVGFKCTFEKNALETGEYQFGVMHDDGYKMVDKRISI